MRGLNTVDATPVEKTVYTAAVGPDALAWLLQAELGVAVLLLAAVPAVVRWVRRREARRWAESERRLREFLLTAGHELRNPLTTISGYAQLAFVGDRSQERVRTEALGRVHDEIERMDSLIDELVLLSRHDLGRELRRRRVDLAELCREAAAAARDCHPAYPVRLLVAPGEHIVRGDPLRLHQVVANLLANARRHTPEGTSTTLAVGTEDGYRVVEVTDDGPGVPPELRARIFEPFVRGDAGAATPGSGVGLGLSVVATVAAAHGGTAALEHSVGGAWFRVRLPAAP
ncbi:sensor histidine kinase [Streptomyces sporangiiformans]|uniref:sensor histidine kinase n=1 Tax=Streptomyces sporangiiformans TaxID=2315329 RepID=UPI001F0947C4|nr:HAMP domain-containing sensor histidine kinase [Streptomyces sporangiiformans]